MINDSIMVFRVSQSCYNMPSDWSYSNYIKGPLNIIKWLTPSSFVMTKNSEFWSFQKWRTFWRENGIQSYDYNLKSLDTTMAWRKLHFTQK